ncbi:MAG: glycerol-3-phosphate 1-O-acyltransferase PlsY [Acidimicrobiia bacterium]
MTVALALVAAYLVGSIDFAVVVARMRGVDIREVGSGNPGTSNVLRTMGKLPAALALTGDLLKGVVAAAMGMVASGVADPTVHWAFAAGLAAVVGHCYPVFHRFRGGKGMATALGALAFTVPLVALVDAIIWLVTVKLSKTASVASLLAVAVTIPLALWAGVRGLALLWLGAILFLVVWRHRANIVRMARGSEQRVPT